MSWNEKTTPLAEEPADQSFYFKKMLEYLDFTSIDFASIPDQGKSESQFGENYCLCLVVILY
ncbi:MAG: hypothetical protein HeimC3_23570 [Candidatus Heimdallarchaeota archaeon LC_3]|nr:MAG: hypothetical protein HeimC3_23570 [Candidatus Heimdallarchaeota archaeon LC_3]